LGIHPSLPPRRPCTGKSHAKKASYSTGTLALPSRAPCRSRCVRACGRARSSSGTPLVARVAHARRRWLVRTCCRARARPAVRSVGFRRSATGQEVAARWIAYDRVRVRGWGRQARIRCYAMVMVVLWTCAAVVGFQIVGKGLGIW
jgi:hypothetical protein